MTDSIEDDWIMVEDEEQPDETLSQISKYIDQMSDTFREINLEIHDHPELKFRERHAHEVLTAFMKKQSGWQITPSAYGLETAFVAVYKGHGVGPVVSFNAEYDSLPDIGHACGHNLIATASLAAALATARVLEDTNLCGRVVLFGTPAEEGGGGKIKLLNRGAYRDNNVDISLISHPSTSPDAALVSTAAYAQFNVEYFSEAAHAAAAPWEGINALDALILAINGVSLLRQQTVPGDLIQYKITNGGLKPNIIHAYASGMFVLRAPTSTRLARLKKKFRACLEGAAKSTSARLQVKEGLGYLNHVPNHILGISYGQYFNELGGHINKPDIDELTAITQASTDQGDISHAMPSLSPNFWIRSEDADGKQLGGPHTPDFEKAARTEEAHRLALRVAKALAATAFKVIASPGMLDAVKREFHSLKESSI